MRLPRVSLSTEAIANLPQDIAPLRERRLVRESQKVYHYFPDCLPTCKPESLDRDDHRHPVTGAQP